jgi:two-component system sensor histidine kinase SenX3
VPAALLLAVGLAGVLVGLLAGVRVARRRDTPPPRPEPARLRMPPLPTLSSFVIAALDHGVVVVDARDRVVLVNPAARAMDIVDVDRLAFEPLNELARRAREDGSRRVDSIDLPMGRLGREPIALAVTAVPLRTDDGDEAVGLLLADVSEQRRLEAVRRDFVANVSHELKTPVGALALLAEAVQDAAGEPEAVARFAGRMQHESVRLTRLVEDLMELSRVQGMDPMPEATSVGVDVVVAEALARTRLAAEQSAIDVDVRCEPGLVVRGDPTQLATAVANLIDNAVAYSARGTRVVVTAVACSDREARPCVDLGVADQGLGIAEPDLDRIFERFYRVDPARSRATGGTGLGLAIVRNIVANHLGNVRVDSVVGEGSTFTIRLPRVHLDERPAAVDAAEAADAAPVTVEGAR